MTPQNPDFKLDGPMIQSLKKVIKTDMKLSLHLETFLILHSP